MISILLLLPLKTAVATENCSIPNTALGYLSHLVEEALQKVTCAECAHVRTSCDLMGMKRTPEIILIGEVHDDKRSIAAKETLFSLASVGRIFLATEVEGSSLFQFDINKNVLPLEDPDSYGLTWSYYLQGQLILGENSIEALGRFRPFLKVPMFKNAFESLRQTWLARCPRCYSSAKGDLKAPGTKLTQQEQLAIKEFLYAHHEKVIQLAQRQLSHQISDLRPIKTLEDAQKLGVITGRREKKGNCPSQWENILINLRNRDYAGKISDAICKLNGATDRIFVLVGNAHAEGLETLLKGLSGRRVSIRHIRSFEENASHTINLLIGTTRYVPR